jgi:hypothetical protein
VDWFEFEFGGLRKEIWLMDTIFDVIPPVEIEEVAEAESEAGLKSKDPSLLK